jgi:hypothetical protein
VDPLAHREDAKDAKGKAKSKKAERFNQIANAHLPQA